MRDFKNSPKDEWTLNPRVVPGQHFMSCFHRVECLSIIEKCEGYNIAKVRVLGPVPGADGYLPGGQPTAIQPMRWDGKPYDTEGVFAPQEAIR